MALKLDPPGLDRRGLVPHVGSLEPGKMNKRQRANIPALLLQDDPTKFPPIYIFNIFNREHRVHLGGKGMKTIPACQPGQPFSEPLALKAIEIEEFDLADGVGNMSFTAEDGLDIANDIIGVRSTYAELGLYTTNMQWWGCFATLNNPPKKEEIEEAKKRLTRMMRVIYEDGKQKAASGPMGLAAISPNHNLAAEFLGEAKPWTTAPEVARISCPECAEKIMPTAKICIHCHSKLDGKGNLATK
jgi:hypothetical protein